MILCCESAKFENVRDACEPISGHYCNSPLFFDNSSESGSQSEARMLPPFVQEHRRVMEVSRRAS